MASQGSAGPPWRPGALRSAIVAGPPRPHLAWQPIAASGIPFPGLPLGRLALERHQVWCHPAGVLAGLALGATLPVARPDFEALLWPVLAGMPYGTFVQEPMLHLYDAIGGRRDRLAAGAVATAAG